MARQVSWRYLFTCLTSGSSCLNGHSPARFLGVGGSSRLIYGTLRSLEVGKFTIMEAYLRELNPPTATPLGRGGPHGASSADAMPTTTATVQVASHGTQICTSLFIEVCLLHHPTVNVYYVVWQVQMVGYLMEAFSGDMYIRSQCQEKVERTAYAGECLAMNVLFHKNSWHLHERSRSARSNFRRLHPQLSGISPIFRSRPCLCSDLHEPHRPSGIQNLIRGRTSCCFRAPMYHHLCQHE